MEEKRLSGSAIFVGTSAYAAPSLEALADIIHVSAVITNTSHDVVAQAATQLGIKIYTPAKIQNIESEIRELKPSVMIVGHYGQIIPKEVLEIPTHGSINIHPSLLPRHRGPAPVPATILAGDLKTGTTIISMDEFMDHGPILAQSSELVLQGDEYADDLLMKLWKISANLLRDTLPKYLDGVIVPQPQDESRKTTHGYMHRNDGQLQSGMGIDEVWRKHRAYRPWPGTWMQLEHRGQSKRFKFIEMEKSDQTDIAAGRFTWRGGLYLGFTDGTMKILRIQPEGGKPLSDKEFYNGYKDLIMLK